MPYSPDPNRRDLPGCVVNVIAIAAVIGVLAVFGPSIVRAFWGG